MNILLLLCLFMVIPSQIFPGEDFTITIVSNNNTLLMISPESNVSFNGSKFAIVPPNSTIMLQNNATCIEVFTITAYDGSEFYGCIQLIYR